MDVEGSLGFAMDTSELLIELTCILFLVHGDVAAHYKEKNLICSNLITQYTELVPYKIEHGRLDSTIALPGRYIDVSVHN